MAETMTYDPGTDTVTTEDSLTPDEQESLKVGEEMESQQQQLLAGKYKTAEELEKAYGELEKKLGEQESEEQVTEEEPTKEDVNPTVSLITDASTEYSEKGELSKETLDKFSEMSSADLVNAYVEMQQNAPQVTTETADLSDSEVNTIKNSVGGEKSYDQLVTWASQNLAKDSLEAFDGLITTGNVKAIQLALSGLKAEYDNANGYEGRMLTGKSAKTSSDIFRSQQELVAAMSDPRYENDPAYRQDVIAKLDRSDNLQF
mgnify:CR=1 FL=1